ncbi:hypothetical protein ACOME3_008093 [Neoechinorhynchus agilis]
MSDESNISEEEQNIGSGDLIAGHPPARRVGGVRHATNQDYRLTADIGSTSSFPATTAVVNGKIVKTEFAFPTEATKNTHEKSHHEQYPPRIASKPNPRATRDIRQPRR